MRLIRRGWLAGAALGLALVAASIPASGAAPRKGYLFPAAEIIEEGEEYSWLPAAQGEAFKMIFQRLGPEVLDDPRGAPLPADFTQLTSQQARAWLGTELASRVGYLVFSRVKLSGEEATVTFYAYDLVRERPVRENRVGGRISRLPSLLKKQADFILDVSDFNVSAEEKEDAYLGFTESVEALRALSVLAAASEPNDRIRALEAAVAADPRFASAWMQLGLTWFALGKKADSRQAFIKVLETSPRFKEAYNDLGVILSDEPDAGPAVQAFREALRIDDGYLDARFNLAKLLDRERRNDDALKEYEKLLASQPERNEARFMMALVLDRTGNSERALEEFRRLSRQDSALAEDFFLTKGREARQARKYPDAALFFKRALDINPKLVLVYRELGITSFMAGEYEQAVTHLREAAARSPESAEVQHYLGLAAAKAGRAEEAVAAFKRAVELGNLKESNLELGRLYFEQGRYAESLGSLNRYLKDEPDSDEAKNLLAQATRKAREEADAMQKQSDFAMHRLDRMEEVVRDLNRRNSELETKLTLAAERSARLEEENRVLREGKAGGELELNRKLQESTDNMRRLNEQISALQSAQEQRIAGLEQDLARERKVRQDAEDKLRNLVLRLQAEGKVTVSQGPSEEELEENRRRTDALQARIGELQAAQESAWRALEAGEQERERLTAEQRREMEQVAASREEGATELRELREAYERRLLTETGRLPQALAELDGLRGRLEAQRKQDGGSLETLESRLALLEAERSSLRDQAAALRRQLDEAEAADTALREERDGLKMSLAAAIEERSRIRPPDAGAAQEARQALTDSEQKLKDALETAAKLSRGREQLLRDLQDLDRAWQEKQRAWEAALKVAEESAARAQEQFSASRGEIQGGLKQAQDEAAAAWKKISGLEKELEASRKKAAELEREVAALRKKPAAREEGLLSLRQERDAAREQLASLKKDLDRLKKDSGEIRSAALERFRDLGDLYRQRGHRPQAEEAYLLVLRYDPGNGKAYLALGELYYEMGQYDKSKEMYAKAASLLKEDDR